MRKALALLRRIELYSAIALLAVIVAVVLAGTIGRYGGHPVIWSDEVAQALFIWLAMLAADLTLQRSGHFRITVLAGLLPDTVRFLLDLAIKLVIAAMLAMLIFYGSKLAMVFHPRPLPMTGVPSSYAGAALPVAYGLMLITAVEQIVDHFRNKGAAEPEVVDVM